MSKVLTYGKIVSYLLAFLILSLAALIHYQDSRYGTGVVITRQGQVFQNPDESSAAVSTAHEGYLLRVDYKESSEQEEWLRSEERRVGKGGRGRWMGKRERNSR